jgi:hypothetical protein
MTPVSSVGARTSFAESGWGNPCTGFFLATLYSRRAADRTTGVYGSANARDFISALLAVIASLFLLVGLLWGRRVVGLEGIHDVEKACDHHDAK